MSFLTQKREQLRVLLSALDQQANELDHEAAVERDVEKRASSGGMMGEGLKQTRSVTPFEEIEREEGGPQERSGGTGGWVPWGWGGKEGTGKSSGVDSGR